MVELLSRSERREGAPAVAPLNVPLFRALLQNLDEERRWVVLDLGQARRQTVALFDGLRCRLDVVDLADDLADLNREDDEAARRARAQSLVTPRHEEPLDLVLCWDLLNYLERPALKTLMACIAKRTRSGAHVHALMCYSTPKMPAVPSHHIPTHDLSLIVIPATGELRNAPRYTPEDLALCMPAYRMDRAMLLRNGMQEFLFRV